MTRAIIPCARCGSQPRLEIKQDQPCSISKDGRWFRLVCCGAGRFFLTPGRALRAWNGAQIGKAQRVKALAHDLRRCGDA